MANEDLNLVGTEALDFFQTFLETNAADVEVSSLFPEGVYLFKMEPIDLTSEDGMKKHFVVYKRDSGDWPMLRLSLKVTQVISGGGDTPEQAAKVVGRVHTEGMMVEGKDCPGALILAAAMSKMSVDDFKASGGAAIPMGQLLPALSGNSLVAKIVHTTNKKGRENAGISFKKSDPLMHPEVWEAAQIGG